MLIDVVIPTTRSYVNEVLQVLSEIRGDFELRITLILDNPKIQIKPQYKVNVVSTRFTPVAAFDVAKRRDRITEVFQIAQKTLQNYKQQSQYTWIIEDDTVIQPGYLLKLLGVYRLKEKQGQKVGFVSGVQAGRWGFRMLGLWHFQTNRAITLPFLKGQIKKITSAGFYCMLIKTSTFVHAPISREIKDFGVDVNYGLELQKQGFINYVDYDVICGHVTPHGIIMPMCDIIELEYIFENSKWKRIKP